MASLFNSKHNKYVSIPDWFKDTDLSVQQTVEHKTTYVSGGGAVSVASGLSNVILYNKFVIEDAELDKDALTIADTVLNTVESETIKIGDTISLSGWSTTDYISIASGSVMVITSYIDTELNKLYGILFYDNTRSVIGSHLLTSSPEEVSIPAGVFYFRISTTVTDDFKIVYKVSKEYNEDQLLQSNNNITDYLSLNELIPEGINETSVTDNALKLLVQSPLALTRDLNNVIKLSMKQVNGSNINDMFVWDKKLAAFGYDEVSKQAYSYVDGQQQFDIDGNPVMTNNPDFWMYDENLEDRWIIKSTRSRLSWLDNLFEYNDEKNCFVLHGNLATTGGIVTYANAGDINIDNIYDGLPIDWDTIYWEEGVLKSKSNGSGIKEVIVNGNGNALTGVYWNSEDNTLSFNKDKTFTELQYVQDNFLLKNEIDGKLEQYVTINTEQTITGKKDFTTGGLFVNGNQIVYNDANRYWLLEGDLLVTGGITSFASVSGFEPSSIMDALIVDDTNLKVINGVLTFIGSTGGEGGTTEGGGTISSIAINGTGNAITSVALNEDKTRLTFIKGMNFITSDYLQEYYWNKTEITDKYYSKLDISNNYYNKFYIDENFITKDGASGLFVTLDETQQDINGVKNFIGELQVNGNPIVYNSEEGYWMLDGDLLVTGDITSFANENGYTPSSIMDALVVDGSNLKVVDGVLTFVGSTGGGGGTADSVHWDNIEGKPDFSSYATEDYVNDQGFLKPIDIAVLTFTNGKFSAVSYDPSMTPKTVNIPTKLSHLEDDSDFVTLSMMSSYATKTWVGQQGFLDSSDLNGYATETWVGNNYLPLTGSLPSSMDGEFKLQGDLRLRDGTEYYGQQLFFGDGDYCYIGELSDNKMTIYGDKGVVIKTNTSSSTKYYIELTAEGIKLNGGLLKYNGSYWEIEGDLLVTGGITSYS